jgi:ABC-type Fe3+ transport system substrate-binding protein
VTQNAGFRGEGETKLRMRKWTAIFWRRPLRRWGVGALIGALGLASAPARAADPALIAAARKEGTVVWYTTQIVDQVARPAARAFERLYPGISVTLSRTNATTAAVKILNENRAGRNQADVFDGTTTVVPLKEAGYVLKWLPDAAKNYPAEYKDPEGYWIATNLYVLTPAFNTSLVKPGTEPRTLQALLDPRWRGKMAWADTLSASAAIGFIGNVLTEMGEEKGLAYLKGLQAQRIAGLGVSARQVLDQTIAGEYPIALQIFNHHAVISANEGAPVAWIPMEPAMGVLSVVSIPLHAPHPNAAKLFEDFLVSKAGQKIYQQTDYLPADPAVPALTPSLKPEDGHFRSRFFSPEELAEKMPQWKAVYDELFR